MANPMNKRSIFDLTHEKKLSCEMGKLVPVMCTEVLPGDTWEIRNQALIRLAPTLAPVMHRMNVFFHTFFVPTRLVFSQWESFITGGVDGMDTTPAPTIITPATTGFLPSSLADYLGVPTGVPGLVVSALPFRAYALIWNQWYKNQNLQDDVSFSTSSGTDTTTSVALLKRNWEKDYFTGCLPWTQRGAAVGVPVGGMAPVVYNPPSSGSTEAGIMLSSATDASHPAYLDAYGGGSYPTDKVQLRDDGHVRRSIGLDPGDTLKADLSEATPVEINELRQAFQLQKWMERSARGGARYVESILAHWGVRSSDARLQRPEFLGGGKCPIVISEVLQNSSAVSGSPQGNMAGHGYGAQETPKIVKSFEEHGYILTLMSVMPRTAYQEGLHRMWTRSSRYDYAWPEFAHTGEQGVYNKEVYAKSAHPDDVFGYQPRYEEYRKLPSMVHGDFRSSLAFWHLGRVFGSTEPVLNADFVSCVPDNRIFAVVAGTDHLWCQVLNSVKAVRCLPKQGVPGFIDH